MRIRGDRVDGLVFPVHVPDRVIFDVAPGRMVVGGLFSGAARLSISPLRIAVTPIVFWPGDGSALCVGGQYDRLSSLLPSRQQISRSILVRMSSSFPTSSG